MVPAKAVIQAWRTIVVNDTFLIPISADSLVCEGFSQRRLAYGMCLRLPKRNFGELMLEAF